MCTSGRGGSQIDGAPAPVAYRTLTIHQFRPRDVIQRALALLATTRLSTQDPFSRIANFGTLIGQLELPDGANGLGTKVSYHAQRDHGLASDT